MPPHTMKAAVCNEANQPLQIKELPVPKPTGRQVLVRVKAASICHTDLGIVTGKLGPSHYPLIIGHEAVSVVEQLGPKAEPYGIRVGDVIGAPLWNSMCLDCDECRYDGPEFCQRMEIKGITAPGYFAEYTLMDPASAVVIARAGESGSTSQLSPLFCAGITVWDALERADLQMGQTVAILGVGGLGQLATKYAHELGIKVIALDVRNEQLQATQADGSADAIINMTSMTQADMVQNVRDSNNGRLVGTVIVTAGVAQAYQSALAIVRPGGHIIAAGIPDEPVPLHMSELTNRCIRISGSKAPGKAAAQRCLDFTMRRKILPKINPRKFKLEEINEMISLMKANKVEEGRMVVEFF